MMNYTAPQQNIAKRCWLVRLQSSFTRNSGAVFNLRFCSVFFCASHKGLHSTGWAASPMLPTPITTHQHPSRPIIGVSGRHKLHFKHCLANLISTEFLSWTDYIITLRTASREVVFLPFFEHWLYSFLMCF